MKLSLHTALTIRPTTSRQVFPVAMSYVRASTSEQLNCERVIASLRRECIDHVVAIDEHQRQRVLDGYVRYYNRTRTHLALAKDAPDGSQAATPGSGRVVSMPEVGGLRHRSERLAA